VDAVRFYSLSAKAEGPARTELMAGPMLQALIEERFQLNAHRETREMPVYAMTVGKGGLKVDPLAEGACTPIDLTHPPPPAGAWRPPPNLCGIMMMGFTPIVDMTIEVRGANMTQFAQRLSGRVDRAVVDKTDVSSKLKFNFRLEFAPDPDMRGQAVPAGRGGMRAALPVPAIQRCPRTRVRTSSSLYKKQIGLKLSPDKGRLVF